MNAEKKEQNKDFEWTRIRSEYVTKKITYKQLCEKYGCSMSALTKRAAAEKWQEKRKKHRKRVETKTLEKAATREAEKNANNLSRCGDMASDLLDKLGQAIDELDQHLRSVKRVVTRDETIDGQKAVVVESSEKYHTEQSIIKTSDLKRISATLRDIKDVIVAASPGDNLEKEIVVRFDAGIDPKWGR